MSTTSFRQIGPVTRDASLRTRVARELIRAMFTGKIVAGDRLVVQKLATQLGSSSTPVREALVELHTLGLAELIPNRGGICLPFGAPQLGEIYLVRAVLEAEATRRAAECLPNSEASRRRLQEILDGLRALQAADDTPSAWSDEALRVDVALHDLVASCCAVGRLTHEIERYKELMGCVREVVGNERCIQQIAVGEHITIAESLLAGQGDDAARAMRDHLEHTAELVAGLLFGTNER
jgi:DNA-binding GntR family transcriptional regulator